ncbi:MAG: hypothetical protein HZC28_19315 [Spirochaetes bacterium]|nr:hypothetical protein [Spirochaetota bacterium]
MTTNAPFTVSLDVDENNGYFSTNGSTYAPFSTNGVSILIDRTTTLAYFGRDALRNTSATNIRTYTLIIPRIVAPVITLEGACVRSNPCRSGTAAVIDNLPDGTVATVYSVSGRRIIDIPSSRGVISWNLVTANGKQAAPGVYLCHLRSASGTAVLSIMVHP